MKKKRTKLIIYSKLMKLIFKGTLGAIFKSFSVITNAPKLLSGKSGPGAITCLHGIRFFSITWIILGHTYNYGLVTNPGVMTTSKTC